MGDDISRPVSGAFDDEDGTPRSQSSGGFSPQQACKALPSDTLIIFDWDDTLLCSSAINYSKWSYDQLDDLERAAGTVLEAAMKLGEVMIITNGNATWVEESSNRFVPGLVPILKRITSMSAREHFEEAFPGDPFSWKRAAFRHVLDRRRQQNCQPPAAYEGLNLIVLGDSPAEMEAAHYATHMVRGRNTLVKTVKFKELPSVPELLGQLERTALELDDLVYNNRSVSKVFEPTAMPAQLRNEMTCKASGWKLGEGKSWSGRPTMAQALLMPDDDDIFAVELPPWMVEMGEKVACWQQSLVQNLVKGKA